MLSVIRAPEDRQSGRTTMAVAMVMGMNAQGIPACLIFPSQSMCHEQARRFRADKRCFHTPQSYLQSGAVFRCVVIDDLHLHDRQLDLVHEVSQKLALHCGPTQLVLIP